MKTRVETRRGWRVVAAAGLGVGLLAYGCGMDGVAVPPMTGPAEMNLTLRLTVNPDVLTADGQSTAMVRAEARGPNGPLSGVDVLFGLADEDGSWADLGTLSVNRRTTDGSGIAEITYFAPQRTDATANQTIQIRARPVLNDANAAYWKYVRLELRSPEPKMFPQNPGNKPPTCSFTFEAPNGLRVGADILMQDTSSDSDGTVVRYMWSFGDDTDPEYFPDVNHAYRAPGNYTVTHKVVDDDGGEGICTKAFPIS
jgi:PKD repeat protein